MYIYLTFSYVSIYFHTHLYMYTYIYIYMYYICTYILIYTHMYYIYTYILTYTQTHAANCQTPHVHQRVNERTRGREENEQNISRQRGRGASEDGAKRGFFFSFPSLFSLFHPCHPGVYMNLVFTISRQGGRFRKWCKERFLFSFFFSFPLSPLSSRCIHELGVYTREELVSHSCI